MSQLQQSSASGYPMPLQYFSPVQESKRQFWGAVTLLGALVAGTGGVFDVDNTVQIPIWTKCSVIPVNTSDEWVAAPTTNALSFAERLEILRDTFGLKMSELAQIFGVSRQAAYAWLAGTSPKGELRKKIWILSNSAEELRHTGIERPELFTHRPLLQDGRSLFDLLVSGEPLEKAIVAIRLTAQKEARLRSEASTRHPEAFNGRKSWTLQLAKPILEEEER